MNYHIFAGDRYYPLAPPGDFRETINFFGDTTDATLAALKIRALDIQGRGGYDWVVVLDESMKLIYQNGNSEL